MDLSQKIIRLNQLAAELNHEKSVDTMKSKINTYENIDQYLEWYTDSKILFSEYFDDKNELYKEFKSFDTAGNGFVLMSQFTRQFPIYKRLIEQIKSNSTQTNMIMESKKRIFISHSNLDEKITNDFVNKILQNGLGINPIKDVFCTSVEGLKIRSGEDFRKNIKQNIISTDIVILLISVNYKKSEICLNEMGACWVLGKRVIPIIIPPINYKTVGAITEPLQCLNLLTDSGINQLCDELIEDMKIDIKDVKV
ncbi:MAG: toll/interleukin-1 receptor domain-containing protein, partial [Bacteroidetes bacterium]|nr:toll/interleukin-1 receptor domain-containing protein [Bacteroidota bacterium]